MTSAARRPSSVWVGGIRTSSSGEVGLVPLDGDERGLGVADGLDDLDAVGREQTDQPVAQEDRVLGDHDPHGISALSTVGPPTGLVTVRVPSTDGHPVGQAGEAGARAGRGAAPPVVAHLDDEALERPTVTRTVADVAPECRATLVRASDTTK